MNFTILCNLLAIRAQSFWLLQLLFVMFYNNKIVSRIFQFCLIGHLLIFIRRWRQMVTCHFIQHDVPQLLLTVGLAHWSSLFRGVVLPEGPISWTRLCCSFANLVFLDLCFWNFFSITILMLRLSLTYLSRQGRLNHITINRERMSVKQTILFYWTSFMQGNPRQPWILYFSLR